MSQSTQYAARGHGITHMVFVGRPTDSSARGVKSVWLDADANSANETVPAGAATVDEAFPMLNTPEWDAMNVRRAELIRKDLDEGLTPAEREEYERLQRLSLAAVAKAFPRPRPDFEELARLRKELCATSALVTE